MILFKNMGKFLISATIKKSYNILDILKSRNTNKIRGLQNSVAFYAVYPVFFGVAVCNSDWNESQNFSSFACFCPIVKLREFVTRNQANRCYQKGPEFGMPRENLLSYSCAPLGIVSPTVF
jgi:hypothetical protein